jgi:uncharacterized OsmC-like protein
MKNGINVSALAEMSDEIKHIPSMGIVKYGVQLQWLSGTRSHVQCLPMEVGDQKIQRDFQWSIDEPKQLGGSNHSASPQEYLLSGFGSCMMVAFLVGASVMGIQLSTLKIEVKSKLDLAGFLGVNETTKIELQGIDYVIHVSGDGTDEQFEQLRQQAQQHSPNAMSLANAVSVQGRIQTSSITT